ncbi:alpha/beta hydrolase [Vreelandella sp. EE22]
MLAVCLPLAVFALPSGEANAFQTQAFTLTSSDTGQAYSIQVAQPSVSPPEGGYSVLYLLDGNAQLPRMEAARKARQQAGMQDMPLLVVAIGYPEEEDASRERRGLDYTPAVSGQALMHPHGGADRFLRFIQTELKPEINRRFATDTADEAIMGHSYGGLFVLHTLLGQPRSFKRYIAISPSLWWYGDKPFEALNPAALAEIPRGTRLMVGVGEQEQLRAGQPIVTERDQRLGKRAMVDNARMFAEWASAPPSPLEASFTLYPGEGHGSVMGPASHDALAFLGQSTF